METRKIGEKFEYKGKVYKTRKAYDRETKDLICGVCDLRPDCKNSLQTRGECAIIGDKRYFTECTWLGAFFYRAFGL